MGRTRYENPHSHLFFSCCTLRITLMKLRVTDKNSGGFGCGYSTCVNNFQLHFKACCLAYFLATCGRHSAFLSVSDTRPHCSELKNI